MKKPPWNATAVQQAVDSILNEELYWFPVRHHSPTVAKHLLQAIETRKPKIVFIEGPADAQGLIPYIVDKKTIPPIAIYSSYRDDDNTLGLAGIASPAEDIPARFSSWYPMIGYSPEYVAIKAATKLKSEIVLMDLPHYALIQSADQMTIDQSQEEDCETLPPKSSEPINLYPEESLYQRLAEKAGFNSWNEAWDSLFEFGEYTHDLDRFRNELTTFCAAARLSSDPARLESDGTLARERFMWKVIRTTLEKKKIKASDAMIICGGFHLFMDRNDNTPPPALPQGSKFKAVMPYSFFQISELSGYGAGNRAPRFYQTVWNLRSSQDQDDWLSQHIVSIIKQARREGEKVSSADAISIAQHARMLAALRGRSQTILEDIEDAVFTCCCKGDPQQEGRYLQKAIDSANIGKKIGKVTPASPRLPLVIDFYDHLQQLELQQLLEQEKRHSLKLDKRQPHHHQQSVFLHRLNYLQVPFCNLIEGKSNDLTTGTLFKEIWHLKWNPEVEPALIENNLFGDTLETAVFSRLEEALAKVSNNAAETCHQLRLAVDMELPSLVLKLENICAYAIAHDQRFISLSSALHELMLLQHHAIYQQLGHDIIDTLLEATFDRACFSLAESANVKEEEQEELINALRVVSEALLGHEKLDQDLFIQHVGSAAEVTEVPFLEGAFIGMLTELRVISVEESSEMLADFARQPVERRIVAGDFLDGMLATCRTSIMLGAEHIVSAIEQLLSTADDESFLIMLPRMRIAFNRLHNAQRSSIADRVAKRLGLKETEQLTKLETSVEAALLFSNIDKKVAKIMQEWDL